MSAIVVLVSLLPWTFSIMQEIGKHLKEIPLKTGCLDSYETDAISIVLQEALVDDLHTRHPKKVARNLTLIQHVVTEPRNST